MDDKARKEEATRRLQGLFGVDNAQTSAASHRGVRRRDETWDQIVNYILQDIGRPPPKPEPFPEACVGTRLHDLGLNLPRIHFLAWTNLHGVSRPYCRTCKNFEEYENFPQYETTFGRVCLAALSGCPMCMIIRHAVMYFVPEHARSDDSDVKCVHGAWSYSTPQQQPSERIQMSINLFELQGRTYILRSLPGLQVASLIPGDTASNESFMLTQKWLEICNSKHQMCGRGADAALPKRVLDVSKKNVFLYESHNEHSRYICLSHCWGPTRPRSLTTSETISQYKKSIPWDHFSRNFQDAIHFCRRLGVQYLWIDSLCILQDDEQDWREQSTEMHTIYANAYLTLAATKSPNSDGGCYSAAPSDYRAHEILPYGVFVRKPLPHIPHRMMKLTSEKGGPFPLLWRAWVYQERRLSKRMLHFTTNELAWECREGTACECSPNLEHITPDHLIGNNKDSNSEKWHGTILEYSSLDLTYEKDKFPALSGIAKRMQQTRPSDIYLAGLWKSSLLKDLLWHASADLLERPQQWRAPSWSWASINSPISYDMGEAVTWIQVLEASCSSIGPDPYGELSAGFLRLKAPLFPGHLRYDISKNESGLWRYTIEMDDFERRSLKADYVLSSPDKHHVPPDTSVRLLIAAHTEGSRGNREFHGIVMRILKSESCTMERIGWVTIFEEPAYVQKKVTATEAQVFTFV